MKKRVILFGFFFLFGVSSLAFSQVQQAPKNSNKDEGGLFSDSSSDVSATAGVRGGDVMGDSIKKSQPNTAAVNQMEQRRIPSGEMDSFQKEGHVGRYVP